MRDTMMNHAVRLLVIVGVLLAIAIAVGTLRHRKVAPQPDHLAGRAVVADDFPRLAATENGAATPLPDRRNEGQVLADSDGARQTATFGTGCFWCTEAVFERLEGVASVTSGYSGGHVENPSYESVCSGESGHAEVVQVTYDSSVISYAELLEVFWRTHDPTTPNRQGADEGPQYRSAIFFHNDRQREWAEKYRQLLDEAGVFDAPIVTEITPFTAFYPAEREHQSYYTLNAGAPYCRYVIQPKMEKLKKVFREKLKPGL